MVRYVKLNRNFSSESALQNLLEELSRAPKQREVVLTLFSVSAKTRKPVKVSDLSNESGASTLNYKIINR